MKKITKRYLSVLLTFALVLALPLAATQEVNAASGGKKINQPVQVTVTSSNPKVTPEITTYVYELADGFFALQYGDKTSHRIFDIVKISGGGQCPQLYFPPAAQKLGNDGWDNRPG